MAALSPGLLSPTPKTEINLAQGGETSNVYYREVQLNTILTIGTLVNITLASSRKADDYGYTLLLTSPKPGCTGQYKVPSSVQCFGLFCLTGETRYTCIMSSRMLLVRLESWGQACTST